ncbi:MAG: hypothetical protein GFH27_549279n77 [Chloroflexi bacterium AL-W]|nr:hypothetical protein [Chloroflexi bacterium AL-N1]NOK65043.1 hypothetical protein [Chloroflexi bacterium AL-N10]NOK72690.1 hypothetical protein [Chloroflexi bacterium AL-N5]NOK79222.1 hypothetical protein [Chloroflexi bacterium AL-W]NOK87138.1 hypothetical protein [Chloroflexi bacterium AL-N15]
MQLLQHLYSAVEAAGALVLELLVSVVVVVAVSLLVVFFESSVLFVSLVLVEVLLADGVLLSLRLSVIYQPEPLKTIPTGWKTRRTDPEHAGQVCKGASLNDWNCSNCAPHESHA